MQGKPPYPALAYLILRDKTLLASDPGRLEGAVSAEGPDAQVIWKSAAEAFAARQAELEEGEIFAPGNLDADGRRGPEESVMSGDNVLTMAPPCTYCERKTLCGQAFARDESDA